MKASLLQNLLIGSHNQDNIRHQRKGVSTNHKVRIMIYIVMVIKFITY